MRLQPTNTQHRRPATIAPASGTLLTVKGAANLLGVHANTVRAWTDQGMLTCLRINTRGDRRYRRQEIERFLVRASADIDPPQARRPKGSKVPSDVAHMSDSHGDSALLEELSRLAANAESDQGLWLSAAAALCVRAGYTAVALVRDDGTLEELVGRGRVDRRLVGQAVASGRPVIGRRSQLGNYRAATPVSLDRERMGVLLLTGSARSRTAGEEALLSAVGAELSTAVRMRGRVDVADEGLRQAELLMAINSDMGSHLDLPRVLSQLVDKATELFEADMGGVFSRLPQGGFRVRATRNLSAEYCQYVEQASTLPVADLAFQQEQIISISNFPDDPHAREMHEALVEEGVNTLTVAPMIVDGERIGVLSLYHRTRFAWRPEQLRMLEQLAHLASSMLRNAQNYSQMATWAAQLQSIQQLGTRLTRLRTVSDIGQAICAEVNQLIDFHNVRVYRIEEGDCLPVAWRGEVGEYQGEEGAQLRVKVGEGVTGWVARYGLAQNVGNASKDERCQTIPGTEDDLDESLLLAPMVYEDEAIGVIVLAKLGLNQFSSDDLRLLEIYASIAAQAMANADSTERLRAQSEALTRQLNSQRELLRVTESILSTLDTQALLEEIAERLDSLVQVDNICVDLHDQRAGLLRPLFARGVQAQEYLAVTIPDDQGIGGYVLKTGEAQLVQDQLTDSRVIHFDSTGPEAGAMIVAPLRGADRIRGVLTIERLGENARFDVEEFELVKLFAAHVSIALQNAETHRAVELRAETDALTGLWNHGALIQHIDRLVEQGGRFAMLMVDLDYFKRYNDRFGHQAGNVMLQQIANQLRSACRDSDQVFRYGGDEFALLLPNTTFVGARTVAEKVQAALRTINDPSDMPVELTCSIGMAVYPKDGEDGQQIILAADRACYASKRAGRARIATALEGLTLASDFQPTEPTPIDSLREPAYSAA